MKLSDLKNSGHAPSLFSAFLHFDVSFMVWVILGALMPFIATDPALTGANLKITPSAMITKATPYTLIVKGPDATKHEPKTTSHLLDQAGRPVRGDQEQRQARREVCAGQHQPGDHRGGPGGDQCQVQTHPGRPGADRARRSQ